MISPAEFGIEVRDEGKGIHASMLGQYPDIDEASCLLLETGYLAYTACGGSGRLLSRRPNYMPGVRAVLTVPVGE